MNKLLTLFVLALTLISFNSNSYAAQDGAEAAKVTEQDQVTAKSTKDKEKKKKKGADEEEPECD